MSRIRHHNYLWIRKSQRKIVNLLLGDKMIRFFLVVPKIPFVPVLVVPKCVNEVFLCLRQTNRLICTKQVHPIKEISHFQACQP